MQNLAPGAAAPPGLRRRRPCRRATRALVVCDVTGFGSTGPWCGPQGVRPARAVRDRAGLADRHRRTRPPRPASRSPTSPPACTPTAASSPRCFSGRRPASRRRSRCRCSRRWPSGWARRCTTREGLGRQPPRVGHRARDHRAVRPLHRRRRRRRARGRPERPRVARAVPGRARRRGRRRRPALPPRAPTGSPTARSSTQLIGRRFAAADRAARRAGCCRRPTSPTRASTRCRGCSTTRCSTGRDRWRSVATPGGPVRALLPPTSIRGVTPRMDPVPAVGEHTDAVLASLGYDEERIARLRQDGASDAREARMTHPRRPREEQEIVDAGPRLRRQGGQARSASELEHANTYPEALIEQMKELGIFGLAIPEPYGDVAVSTPCYALVTEELARGWMSLAGAMGGHTVVVQAAARATAPRSRRSATCRGWPPARCARRWRSPSPAAAPTCRRMRTDGPQGRRRVRRQRREDVDHQRPAQLAADRGAVPHRPERRPAAPRHEHPARASTAPGLEVSRDLPKLGYKGVESCELSFERLPRAGRTRCSAAPRARASRRSCRAWRSAASRSPPAPPASPARPSRTRCATPRSGRASASRSGSTSRSATCSPTWRPSSPPPSSCCCTRPATYDSGRRVRPGGRAWPSCSPRRPPLQITLNAIRVHGGYGYSTEFDVERYFRDAPLMIVGEGTNEIQRNVIARPARQARRAVGARARDRHRQLRAHVEDGVAVARPRPPASGATP